ncbi:MAG: hypothetical protein RBS84_08135 [Kiritimatiellia bacterium]|jgi:hypothetical protein|nr:hypothetical protein [Kiritimatiellia bacterium]
MARIPQRGIAAPKGIKATTDYTDLTDWEKEDKEGNEFELMNSGKNNGEDKLRKGDGFPVGAPAGRAEQKKPCNRTGRCADREVHATRATFSPFVLHYFQSCMPSEPDHIAI